MDITDARSVNNRLKEICPDIVIHCAALSDTGYSEQHPDESEAVNLYGAINLATSCQKIGCRLIYMSSDQVYNGNSESGPLPENLALHPVSIYGKHKLEAEQRIALINPDAIGLRLTWMYDLPDSPYKQNRNLPVNLLNAYHHGEKLRVVTREYRGITYVWDVVKRIEQCFHLPGGIYNFGCDNHLNSYDTFIEAARLMKLPSPEKWITAEEKRFANQARNLLMDNSKAKRYGINFPETLEGLRLALL